MTRPYHFDKMNLEIKMSDIQLPSEETIIATAKYLMEKAPVEATKYAPVRQLLCRVVAGDSVAAKDLPSYNPFYIERSLARMVNQGFVEKTKDGYEATMEGKRWMLKYALEDLSVPTPKKWDGRWRMVIYDVARHKASLRNLFRNTLKRLGFYNLQESTWIYPYPCEKEIHFIRDYCGMGSDVIYIIAHKIENDAPYRANFGL